MNEFADYFCCSNWNGNGEIFNQENNIVWRFQTTGLERGQAKSGIAPTPIFAFCNASGKELATISREKRLPLAQFAVIRAGLRVCTIWQRSIWFTKFEFDFANESKWKLTMPMFSVSGRAVSDNGAEILVQARTRQQWYVRVGSGFESPQMMAALTFVLRMKLQRT